jgi:hypothetical protein
MLKEFNADRRPSPLKIKEKDFSAFRKKLPRNKKK